MRVLHVDTAREWRGGQTQLLILAGLQPECAVALPADAKLRPALEAAGVRVLPVAFRGSLWGTRGLSRVVRAFQPTVVAAHTSHAHGHCVSLDCPVVVHRRLDFRPSRASRRKYLAVDGYVAVSAAVGDVLVKAGVSRDIITVAWDAVRPHRAPPADGRIRRQIGIEQGTPLALCAGALVAHKGHKTAILALVHLPEWHLVIAGQGPLRSSLLALAKANGVAHRLHLLGQRDDLPACFADADRFVHPSTEEGMGQVVVEAMMAGLPVVVSDVGGLSEIVAQSGQRVPPGDPKALARALAEPPIAPPSFDLLARRFSPQRLLERTEAAYRDAC